MAYILNTGHALYASLVELFGVQGGALVSHKTARTFTKHAEATYGSGTWGEHFSSLNGGYTAKGASFTPAIDLASTTYPNQTVVAVVNATGASSGGHILAKGVGGSMIRSPGKAATGELIGYRGAVVGTTIGTGNKMLTAVRVGETAFKLYNDKVLDYTGTGLGSDYSDPGTSADYLLGWDGHEAIAASLVWLAVFNRELTAGEINDLYDSLGASNTFGLVSTANAAPIFPGPNIGNQTGVVGTPISFSVTSKFSDSDALTFSAIGSWPAGITVSSTGIISGTPTTAGTYASLQVRATDTAAQTVDSDVFSFTISAAGTDATAPGATVTSTGSILGGAAAGGSIATGSFVFDPCENNTHNGALNGVSVNWAWHSGGAAGSATTITNGSGTITDAGMTISGMPVGVGYGVIRTSDGTVVAYQEGTVV